MPASPKPPPRRSRTRGLLATLLLLVGSGMLGGCQAVLFRSLNVTASKADVVVQHHVIYEPAHQLALDVYQPRNAHDAPVVVFFYGGSWKSGKRQWYRWAGEALAKRGLVVVVPDYRLWPKVWLDGFMQDAAHAAAWTHAHAIEYGGNPSELFLMATPLAPTSARCWPPMVTGSPPSACSHANSPASSAWPVLTISCR